ncbi:MAG: hypothetical protein ABI068_07115 [Ktedonobacterales bacterium]
MASAMGTKTTTPNATTTATQTMEARNMLPGAQLVALFLMIAGWAWIAGNFAQPQEPLFADALTDFIHAIPLILLVVFGAYHFGALLHTRQRGVRWAYFGIGVIAFIGVVLLTLGGIVLNLTGVSNANPNSVGIHNLDDAIPAVIQIVGSLLWLVTVFLARRQRAATTQP